MRHPAKVTFVEAEHSLLMKTLNALPIGLVHRCTIHFIQADLSRCFIKIASHNHLSLLRCLQLIHESSCPDLILPKSFVAFFNLDKLLVLELPELFDLLSGLC